MNLDIYFVHAGPGHVMDNVIDKRCVFGNEVRMNYYQTKEIKTMVDVIPRPKIKPYLWTIVKGNIFPDYRMVSAKLYMCLLFV